jgi:hypothetical protein
MAKVNFFFKSNKLMPEPLDQSKTIIFLTEKEKEDYLNT